MIRRPAGRWNRACSVLLGLAIAAPFYWLLIDTTSSSELIAGGVAVVIAAVACSAAYAESTEAAIRPRWLSVVARELAKVPEGIVVVCLEVLAQTIRPRTRRGVLEVEPFDVGEGDVYDLGRRALVEASRSLAPNTVVIGVDTDHDRLLVHRIGARR